MEQNNNIPESIWADGVPAKIEEKDRIDIKELHGMAIKYVVENCLLPRGFKLEDGFPRIEFPNVICKRDGKTYAIVIFPSVYPDFVTPQDSFRIDVVNKGNEHGITTLFAPVGYKSIDEERAKARLMLKGDVFMTTFPGFIIMNNEEKQNFQVKQEELFRP